MDRNIVPIPNKNVTINASNIKSRIKRDDETA